MAAWGAWGASKRGVEDLVARIQQNDPKLASLCIISSMRKVGPDDAKLIASALRNNTVLEELLLSGHQIGVEGASALGAALGGSDGNATLRRLSLGSSNFGDSGVTSLAEYIPSWNVLEDLDLELKGISAEGAKALGLALANNTSLKKINLSRNPFLAEGTRNLIENCWPSEDASESDDNCQLLELDLSETSCGVNGIEAIGLALSRLSCSLRILKCNKNPSIGSRIQEAKPRSASESSNHLANLLHAHASPLKNGLLHLSLSRCDLKDEGFIYLSSGLATNQSLLKLDLGYNDAGQDGCQALAAAFSAGGAPNLVTLVLRMNRAGSDGGVAIASALRTRGVMDFELDFCSNKIGMQGALACASIPGIRDLNIMDCDLGDHGAIALAESLQKNSALLAPSLRGLNVCANDLGDVSVLKLCQALEAVFPLEMCQQMDQSGVKPAVRFVLGIGANSRLGLGSREAAGRLMKGRYGFQVVQDKGAGENEVGVPSPAERSVAGVKSDETAAFQNMLNQLGRHA